RESPHTANARRSTVPPVGPIMPPIGPPPEPPEPPAPPPDPPLPCVESSAPQPSAIEQISASQSRMISPSRCSGRSDDPPGGDCAGVLSDRFDSDVSVGPLHDVEESVILAGQRSAAVADDHVVRIRVLVEVRVSVKADRQRILRNHLVGR